MVTEQHHQLIENFFKTERYNYANTKLSKNFGHLWIKDNKGNILPCEANLQVEVSDKYGLIMIGQFDT